MKRMKKIEKAIVLAGMAALCSCGTGGSSSSYDSSYIATNNSFESKAEETMEMPSYGAGGNVSYETDAESQMPETGEKLVYSGALTIQTRSYSDSAAQLRNRVREFGGIIENENEYTDGGYYTYNDENARWTLYMTVRIPTERFEEFMSGSSDIGNVVSRSSSAVNISKRYNDVSAQIEALEKQQKRLLEMMDSAVTIEDMIAVEDRLSDVQYELNMLKTDRESMDTDVAYSTVNVTLQEVKVYTELSDSFFTKLSNRFVNGFAGFANHMAELILGIVYLLPYILLILAVILILAKTGVLKKMHMPRFFRKRKTDL